MVAALAARTHVETNAAHAITVYNQGDGRRPAARRPFPAGDGQADRGRLLPGARVRAPVHVAFHDLYRVATRDSTSQLTGWPMHSIPTLRPTAHGSGQIGSHYFIVADLRRLLLAGFPAHSDFRLLCYHSCDEQSTRHNVRTKITTEL
jgi:hypothetical protein